MELFLHIVLIIAIVIAVLFVLSFAVYFFNLDMKLCAKLEVVLGKGYDKRERNRKI